MRWDVQTLRLSFIPCKGFAIKSLTSHRQPHVPRSTALFSLLVAAVGGACLGHWMTQPAGTSAIVSIQLLFVLATFALTLVIQADFGETVQRWMSERYWVRALIWLAFGAALTAVISDLLELEFVAQFRNFRG